MKKSFQIFALALSLGITANAQSIVTATFDNLTYEEGLDYEDGHNLMENGYFQDGSFYFINTASNMTWGDYSYFTMGGFSYSKRTARTFDAATYDTDQFNNQIGGGAEKSEGFAVCYGTGVNIVTADNAFRPKSCFVTNNAYVINSVMNGDAYARQFNYDDTFELTIIGKLGDETTGSVTVELASKGGVVFQWIPVDLTPLQEVDEVDFVLSSTDTGNWGMNTPAYFCLDSFVAETSVANNVKSNVAENIISNVRYNMNGQIIDAPQKGVNIVRFNDGTIRKVLVK